MSGAIRTQPRRSRVRSAASLPYARSKQQPAKKSPWAIATGLLSFFNPLRLRSSSPIDVDGDEDDDEPESDARDDRDEHEAPPQSLSARGRQMAFNIATEQPAMRQQQPAMPYLLPDSSSPKKNLETVASFLEQRRGQTISPLEAEGLISLINKSTPAEKAEPFRFSSSVPSTPARGNSPASPTTDLFTLGSSASTSALPTGTSSPRKTLARNPNGVLRWSGGGSARPSKNRYASPAFGTPSRAASAERLVFRDSPADSTTSSASPKRRRLETPGATTPPPIPRSAAPGPSPGRAASAQQFPFPLGTPTPDKPSDALIATTPGTPALMKTRSLPVHPSPLRQAWGNSPASSPSSNGSSPAQSLNSPSTSAQTGTPTKAATLLSALIRDADKEAPRRSVDVRNPYQSASPVSVRVTNTHPPAAASTGRKRARATGRPGARGGALEKAEKEAKEAKEKEEKTEKEKEKLPPQAIMEATLPKGSKRSRPPPHFNAGASLNSLSGSASSNGSSGPNGNLAAPAFPSSLRRSPRLEPQRIDFDGEEQEEEEKDEPPAKRARGGVNGTQKGVNGDVNGSTEKSTEKRSSPEKKTEAAPPAPTPAFPASASAPSFFGANSTTSSSTNGSTATTTLVSSASTGGFEFRLPVGAPKALASAPKEPSKLRYSFAPPTPPPAADKEKEKTFLGMGMGPPPVPKKNAPPPGSTFTGYVPASTSTSSPFTSNATASTSAQAKAAPTPTDPKVAARTMTPTALPAFVFSVLTNAPNLAPEHVKAREAARKLEKSALPVFDFTAPAPASGLDKGKGKEVDKPAVQGFNWAAAGGAPPKAKTAATGSWECGTCMLSNGPEATEKCAVCDAPREKPTPKVAQGFNWAAAGVKPPKPKNAEGSWTCGTCMLTNGPEVKEKCAVCDSPRG